MSSLKGSTHTRTEAPDTSVSDWLKLGVGGGVGVCVCVCVCVDGGEEGVVVGATRA